MRNLQLNERWRHYNMNEVTHSYQFTDKDITELYKAYLASVISYYKGGSRIVSDILFDIICDMGLVEEFYSYMDHSMKSLIGDL